MGSLMVYLLGNRCARPAVGSGSMVHENRPQRTQLQPGLSWSSGLWAKAASLGLGLFLCNRNASCTSLTLWMAREQPKHRCSEQTIHGRSTNASKHEIGKTFNFRNDFSAATLLGWRDSRGCPKRGAPTEPVWSQLLRRGWWRNSDRTFSLWHRARNNIMW